LLAVDPGLGARLRGPAGPGRDAFLAALRTALGPAPALRMPAGITDDRLLGGLDLAASLAAGRRIAERGLLARAHGGVVIAAIAERMDQGTAARLAAVLDTGQSTAERDGLSQSHPAQIGVIALDEGIDDESPPAALLDRLAFWLQADATNTDPADADATATARAALPSITVPDRAITALVTTASALGIPGLRAPILALRAARAAAALAGHPQIEEPDLALAAALVLAPRATTIPAPPPEDQADPPPSDTDADSEDPPPDQTEGGQLKDRILEAAQAALPPDLLAALAASGTLRTKSGGTTGATRKTAQRGRPTGNTQGMPKGGNRLHVLATLRAAAPWQRVRTPPPGRLAIRREDFRIRRFAQKTRSTTIFVVDASGSAALNRLAEAKGAVELLLAECYIRRDRVALLAIRGKSAELLLPPTPSLARAKKSLAALPGGGGTPIAAGIKAALELANAITRAGQSPLAVFLTDGRANIALDGTPGRPTAEADALTLAKAWRASGHAALLVDTAPRPYPFARALAEAAGARYLPLPYADAGKLRDAVKAAGQG
jgi:magnesium chelatase subunit D